MGARPRYLCCAGAHKGMNMKKLLAAAFAALLAPAPVSAGVLYAFEPLVFLPNDPNASGSPFAMTLEFAEGAVAAGSLTGGFDSCNYGPVLGIGFGGAAIDLCPDPEPTTGERPGYSVLELDVRFVGDSLRGLIGFGTFDGVTSMVSLDGAEPVIDDLWIGLVQDFGVCESPYTCFYAGTWSLVSAPDGPARPVVEPAAWLLMLLPLVWLGLSARRSPAATRSASRCCRRA